MTVEVKERGSLGRACFALWRFTWSQLLWSTSTLMLSLPLVLACLFLIRVRYSRFDDLDLAFQRFSNEFTIGVFASFLLPLTALAYGTISISNEREEGTLIYLLLRPIPRPLLILTKYLASLPLILLVTTGSFGTYCFISGPAGQTAFSLYLVPLLLLAWAYTGVFTLFAVWFRHATVFALVYALFMEFFLGNMPGLIKRVAVNFYGRSMMMQAGEPHGLEVPRRALFAPVSFEEGAWTLAGIALVALLLAMFSFHYREYHDL
ncbi:Hypothetical protein PBC10988_41540 [Planctomycetales bacterium 10988]|nr:Hypothetical protein PBC10988_41540 [Planctomycetales bacterium 10988]